jgi:hypothetical protein
MRLIEAMISSIEESGIPGIGFGAFSGLSSDMVPPGQRLKTSLT